MSTYDFFRDKKTKNKPHWFLEIALKTVCISVALFIFLSFIFIFYISVFAWRPLRPEEGARSPGTNPGPLQGQPVLLTAEPSLQIAPATFYFIHLQILG